MNPIDPKGHPEARDLGPSHSRIVRHKPVIGPMEALIADLEKLRELKSVPPSWTEGQIDSWKGSNELYLELDLGTENDSYFEVSVSGGKAFITIYL